MDEVVERPRARLPFTLARKISACAALARELVGVAEVLEHLEEVPEQLVDGLAPGERLERDAGESEASMSGAMHAVMASGSRASTARGRGAWAGTLAAERRGGRATPGRPTKRPSSWTTSPSAVSRPPARRSQIRSQCSALSFLPPVSG